MNILKYKLTRNKKKQFSQKNVGYIGTYKTEVPLKYFRKSMRLLFIERMQSIIRR